jgi:uncharacterized protein (TIGR03437 family)
MFRRAITIGVSVVLIVAAGNAQVNVLTANYGNERSNANSQEKLLTPANVGPSTFGRIGALPVDGQVYAQPLYVSGLVFPGQGTHNVVYIATLHNSLYAYDADQLSPPQLLWKVNFGAPVLSSLFGNYTDVAPEIGILSTPVIDTTKGVIYVVSATPSKKTIAYQLHALNLATGKEMLNGPATVSASVKGNGTGSVNGTLTFDPLWHIQRPALLLANNMVWVAFGSHADQEPWHGWMLSYNAADLSKKPMAFTATPNGWGGSFWQSGFGIAADSTGSLYAISGNGSYDGVTNFGESFLKFSGATPMVTDSFTPPNYQLMEDQDYDLSAGPALVPGTHTLIGGDKYGLLYVVNGNAMGGLDRGNSNAQVVQVSTDGVFNFAIRSLGASSLIYLQEKGGNLKAFSLGANGLTVTPVATSSTTSDSASVGLTVSSNGTTAGTGIVWETTNNRSLPGVPGTLRAFNADNIATELWDSDMNAGDGLGRFAKFANPTVANGRVYVPSWSNAIVVYGPKAQAATLPKPVVQAVVNASSYAGGGVAPGELVTIFGEHLGPQTAAGMTVDASGRVPSIASNTVVLFDGIVAPMVYASATQVSAIAPYRVNSETTNVQVVYQGVASDALSVPVTGSAPGVFTMDASGAGAAIVVNQDGTINSAGNPAPAGSVIFFYATGTGGMNPQPIDGTVVTTASLPQSGAPVTATIGGQTAQVMYAGGAPGMVLGVMQINLKVPAGVGGDAVPLVISANGASSQAGISVAVK